MLTGPFAFYSVMTDLLETLRVRLADTVAGVPERLCVVPGEIAWDGCECGQLAISLSRVYLSESFPAEVSLHHAASQCNHPYVVGTMAAQLVRCAPTVQGDELVVSCAALDESAQVVVSDMYQMLTGVARRLCELTELDTIDNYIIREQISVGPQGMCVGSELRFSVCLRVGAV